MTLSSTRIFFVGKSLEWFSTLLHKVIVWHRGRVTQSCALYPVGAIKNRGYEIEENSTLVLGVPWKTTIHPSTETFHSLAHYSCSPKLNSFFQWFSRLVSMLQGNRMLGKAKVGFSSPVYSKTAIGDDYFLLPHFDHGCVMLYWIGISWCNILLVKRVE